MRLNSEWVLKFQKPDWFRNPEFGVIDTILELRPEIFHLFKSDIIDSECISNFGRKDTPSVDADCQGCDL